MSEYTRTRRELRPCKNEQIRWLHNSPANRISYRLFAQRLKQEESRHAPFPTSKPGENAHE